jgi:hypothetical protein
MRVSLRIFLFLSVLGEIENLKIFIKGFRSVNMGAVITFLDSGCYHFMYGEVI